MKKRAVAMAVADWASLRGEMREDSSSSGATPSSVVVRTFPTFKRPLPPSVSDVVPPPLPTLSTVSLPLQPIPSSKPSTISRPMEEKKRHGDDMSFIRPPSRSRPHVPLEQKDELRSKKEAQKDGSMEVGFSEDEMMSVLDEEGKISRYCKKRMSVKGIPEEKVKKMLNKLEEEGSARRAEFNWKATLELLEQRQANKEDELLRFKDSKSANICEMLLQEQSPFTENVEREFKKKNFVRLVLNMMKFGGLQPVKISEWADRADLDEYYLRLCARGVCEDLGAEIVKIKPGNGANSSTFIMGDALIEYSILFKAIYSNELLANIKAAPGNKIEIENIALIMGLTGLESFLSHINLDHSSAFVIVQERDGRFLKMRE